MKTRILLFAAALMLCPCALYGQDGDTGIPPYKNESLSIEERVNDLLSRLTTDEKISLLIATSPGIERLGIPKYYHGNEALHGIVRPGKFTVFPQAIALSAGWDPAMVHKVAASASDEGRARWNSLDWGAAQTDRFSDLLTFWSPTINMARDPRWGRTPETYGEDPFLTGRMGVAFVTGLQGNDPRYVKVVSTPKHFSANNEEHNRAECNAVISERDLREYYLPAYEACVKEGHAQAIMSAYNAINGIPCTANPYLLTKILREEWGFDGYVVSDCGAPYQVLRYHHFVNSPLACVSVCLRAGLDLECGDFMYIKPMKEALRTGWISEADIDTAAFRVLRARMRLGLFDERDHNPYNALTEDIIASPEHQALALEAARKSLVLLKNERATLPLNLRKIKKIAVVGPNAAKCVFGDYSGTPVIEPVSILDGIRRRAGSRVKVLTTPWVSDGLDTLKALDGNAAAEFYNGSQDAWKERDRAVAVSSDAYSEAVSLAKSSDVVIAVMGTDLSVECETRDRTRISLAPDQQRFLRAIYAANRNVVLVLVAGSSIALNWENDNLPAIIDAWYPGESGGTAVAEALFGDYNPAGRLPLTFYRSMEDLPPFDDYDMSKGRTYQYFEGEPLYEFGYGLSYTSFDYSALEITDEGDSLKVRFKVRNTGRRNGDEVAQLYVRLPEKEGLKQPLKQLKGFSRVNIPAGKTRFVEISVPREQLRRWTDDGFEYPAGDYLFMVGASSSDIRLTQSLSLAAVQRKETE